MGPRARTRGHSRRPRAFSLVSYLCLASLLSLLGDSMYASRIDHAAIEAFRKNVRMPSFPSVEPPNPPKRTSSPRPLSKIFRTLKLSRPRPRSSSPSPTRCRRSTDDDEARSRQSSESRPLSWLGGSWHRHHNGRTRAASPERTEPSVKTPAQPSEYADATRQCPATRSTDAC